MNPFSFQVMRDWQTLAGPPATRAEQDRWLAHQYDQAEADAVCLLTRDPRAWEFASIRFESSPPIAAPLPPAPQRDDSPRPRKKRTRKVGSGRKVSAAPPAHRTVTTPLIGGRRYYDAVIAELATYPGEWAIIATGQTSRGIGQTLKHKGCEATSRGPSGNFTIYARWNP